MANPLEPSGPNIGDAVAKTKLDKLQSELELLGFSQSSVRAYLMPINHAYGALEGLPNTLSLGEFRTSRDMEPSLWSRVSDASGQAAFLIGGMPPTGAAPQVAARIQSAANELNSMQRLLDSGVASEMVDIAGMRTHLGDALRHLTAADRVIGALLTEYALAITRLAG